MTPSVRASLRDLAAASPEVLVIGGGITGAGIARDAALRGLGVVLGAARLRRSLHPASEPPHPRGAPLPRAGQAPPRLRGAPRARPPAAPCAPSGPAPAVRAARLPRRPALPRD